MTPLGSPVVPLEYGSTASVSAGSMSSGGSGTDGASSAAKGSPSPA